MALLIGYRSLLCIDLLLVGCGKEIQPFTPEVQAYFDKIDLEMVEIQSTVSFLLLLGLIMVSLLILLVGGSCRNV